jgi:hypothetical protein
MSDDKKIFCPQCKEWYDSTHFQCRPLDLRCDKCIPPEVRAILYDQRVQEAGKQVAAVVDAAGDARNLRPLERMIDGIYDAWGGPTALCEDAVSWAKDCAATGKKGIALSFISKLLAIHAKVEKTRVEDDWNQLSKAEIKARLTLKLTAILAESEAPQVKKDAIKKILGRDNLD